MHAPTAAMHRAPAPRAGSATDFGQPTTLRAADGVELAATSYPAQGQARATLVLAAATGVPMGFYRRFAQWVAAQGVSALCFDYRGVGRSRPPRLRGFEADFSHWAQDIDAALAHALAASAAPVSVVGHSIGGVLAPAALNAPRAHRLVLVGAQSAYWRDWPHPHRWPMATMWHGLMPALTAACGFFPGRALRLGEDLPRGVAMQWAARPWRDPLADGSPLRKRYARTLPPVHLVAATDDVFATAAALERVRAALAGRAQCHRIDPASLGLARLGHFGVFRASGQALWPRLLALALDDPGAGAPSR
ncbi:MAG TPA: alpha/beta fold hydrolase [Burkholderiaceae bacterium]|nr:alpha/beta fold hydrolase [Burkholderiaceae bacterium]